MGFNTFPCNPYPISTEELNKGNNDDLNTRVAALESDVSDLNSNKANQITIAPFFNAETAYTAGDLVYYNGLSYRCTNDHEGAWDADDFAATTISNELDTLKSGLTNVGKSHTIIGRLQGTGEISNITNDIINSYRLLYIVVGWYDNGFPTLGSITLPPELIGKGVYTTNSIIYTEAGNTYTAGIYHDAENSKIVINNPISDKWVVIFGIN